MMDEKGRTSVYVTFRFILLHIMELLFDILSSIAQVCMSGESFCELIPRPELTSYMFGCTQLS
jgi:hypothetical protein